MVFLFTPKTVLSIYTVTTGNTQNKRGNLCISDGVNGAYSGSHKGILKILAAGRHFALVPWILAIGALRPTGKRLPTYHHNTRKIQGGFIAVHLSGGWPNLCTLYGNLGRVDSLRHQVRTRTNTLQGFILVTLGSCFVCGFRWGRRDSIVG